jgi:hypothetical protein
MRYSRFIPNFRRIPGVCGEKQDKLTTANQVERDTDDDLKAMG